MSQKHVENVPISPPNLVFCCNFSWLLVTDIQWFNSNERWAVTSSFILSPLKSYSEIDMWTWYDTSCRNVDMVPRKIWTHLLFCRKCQHFILITVSRPTSTVKKQKQTLTSGTPESKNNFVALLRPRLTSWALNGFTIRPVYWLSDHIESSQINRSSLWAVMAGCDF